MISFIKENIILVNKIKPAKKSDKISIGLLLWYSQVSKIKLPCFIGLACTTSTYSKCKIELTVSIWQGYSVLL